MSLASRKKTATVRTKISHITRFSASFWIKIGDPISAARCIASGIGPAHALARILPGAGARAHRPFL
jgi:hypothetical protein